MGDRSPIRNRDLASLRNILLRALTKNQIALLLEIKNNSTETISSLLRNASRKSSVPVSTLKSCAKVLRELDMISFGSSQPVKTTAKGKLVSKIVESDRL